MFTALLQSRSFTNQPQPYGPVIPLSMEWTAEGGCSRASLKIEQARLPFETYLDLLRSPLQIFNDKAEPIWWGYVNTVHQSFSEYCVEKCNGTKHSLESRLSSSLDDLANRVAVLYEALNPSTFGEQVLTPWSDDLSSQSAFGVKEKIITKGTLSDADAQQIRDLTLASVSTPQVRCDFSATSQNPDCSLYLDCLGWFSTLSWKHYQALSGVFGNFASQNGSNRMGYGNGDNQFAQSFTLPTDMDIVRARVKARKVGSPTDDFILELQTDSAGSPSGTVLASGSVSGSTLASEGFPWVVVDFTSPYSASPSTTYWLVVRRGTANNSTNYYDLALDENLTFTDGVMRVYNSYTLTWGVRFPNADLLFELYSEVSTTDQMGIVYASVAQFFTALDIVDPSGISISPYDHFALSGLDSFLNLLRIGTASFQPYLALVTPDRILKVFQKPTSDYPAFYLTDYNRLTDRYGNWLSDGKHPTGSWLQVNNKALSFISSSHLDAVSNTLKFIS